MERARSGYCGRGEAIGLVLSVVNPGANEIYLARNANVDVCSAD